jgi:hypothetical protein
MFTRRRDGRLILVAVALVAAVLSTAGCGVSPVGEVLPEQTEEGGLPTPDPAPDGPVRPQPAPLEPKPIERAPVAPVEPDPGSSAAPDEVVEDAVVPDALLGLWTSLDQGAAETVYRFERGGTYDQASVLMQERSTGTFSYTIGMTGLISLDGDQLTLTPTSGTQSRRDPDDPAGDFDRPVTDLTAEQFTWWIADGHLVLEGEYGLVEYEWSADR